MNFSRKSFFRGKNIFFAEKRFFHGKFFSTGNFSSGTRETARPARAGPARSGQVRPGRSGRLRTAQVSDFPTTSTAARDQPRPAGGRPRPPPAEPGCGVTPNQMAPGPAGTGPEKTNFAKWLTAPRAPGGKHRGRWKEGTSPRDGEVCTDCATRVLGGKNPEKHAKITIFHPTPGTPESRGSRNLQTAPDRFPF